ncbi:MAG: hypothetical protein WCS17_06005 [Prevotella sp.]
MSQNAIALASSNFIHDDANPSGLMIMGLPTGIGKTYGNCVMMLSEVENDSDLNFIYITEQNKNLESPYRTLEKIALDKKGDFRWSRTDFKDRILWLKSNVDMFEDGYEDSMKYSIYDCFSNHGIEKDVLNRLLDARRSYKHAKRTSTDSDYVQQLYSVYRETEADLRRAIHKILKKYPGKDKKIKCIEEESDLSWIATVYPVIYFNNYRIVLMSDKKFTETIDPIVSAPFCIWEETDLRVHEGIRHSQLCDHIIIIDEFDTFKGVLEDHLIDDNLKQVDVIRAFRNCSMRIPSWKNLPEEMLSKSIWWGKEKKFSIEERFKYIVDRGNKLRSDYRMQYLFKLMGVDSDGAYVDPPSTSFMFRDYEPHIIGTAFALKMEDGDKYNRILTGKNITAKASRISNMFKSLDYYFNGLCKLVRDLAFNYRSNLEESVLNLAKNSKSNRYQGGDSNGWINCVDSIIDALDMEEDLARYVKNKVLHNRLKTNTERSYELLEPVMFSRGFKYVDMKDSVNRQLQTHMFYTDYDTTPEFILRHMCEVTKVIGTSATGEIDSPLCNFSLQYLREVGVYIHEYSEEDKRKIAQLMDTNKKGYIEGKAHVKTHLLDTDVSYSKMSWESMFDPSIAKTIYNKIGYVSDKEEEDFPELRYIRATKILENFIEHKDIQSMLCFFSAHAYTDSRSTFQIEKLNFIYEQIALKRDVHLKVEWAGIEPLKFNPDAKECVVIIQITGNNFENAKKQLFERLANNEKIMVLTAYQTLGAGQNLQYRVPDDLSESELVWVRGVDGQTNIIYNGREKDFDAIYLDDPTSIGPKVNKNDKKSLDKYLFYIEYADAVNKIELSEKRKQISQAFMYCYNLSRDGYPKHFKNTDIYMLAKGKTVVQAIGRVDRTGWKRKTTHIFLDKQLASGGVFALEKEQYGQFRNQLFDEVYIEVHNKMPDDLDATAKLMINGALRKSHNLMCLIDDLRNAVYGGEHSAIEEWKMWRDFVLKHPTAPLSMSDLSPFEKRVYTYGYIDMPSPTNSYWFCQKNDFRSDSTDGLEISFTKPKKLKKEDVPKEWHTVDSAFSRLDLVLKIEGVDTFMRSMGYATVFESSPKNMCPPLYRNIYMGALGETIGKFLLERDFGMAGKIKEMADDNYEQFDNILSSGAAIDFKDWNDNFMTDSKARDWQLKKIGRKMTKCGLKRVYILNVVLESSIDYQPILIEPIEQGEIVIAPYLYKIGGKGIIFNDDLEKILSKEVEKYD